MKQLIFSIILVSVISPLSFASNFNSGDKQIDRWLVNIDYVAREDQAQAIQPLAKQFKVSNSTGCAKRRFRSRQS